MFDNRKNLPLAFAVLVAGLAISACTTVERERSSSAPPTVVMQAPQQPTAAVIVR